MFKRQEAVTHAQGLPASKLFDHHRHPSHHTQAQRERRDIQMIGAQKASSFYCAYLLDCRLEM